MALIRLQKVLARAGVASRRAAEALIIAGRVSVAGRIVRELGVRVDPTERIEVDGRRLVAEPFVYLILHKPRAVVCTLSDPEGRDTVRDLLRGVNARVIPVGRLDYYTSGALLFTNDGAFAQALQHPKHNVPKLYVAKVKGVIEDSDLEKWRQSIEIDGRMTRPAEVQRLRVEGDKTWLRITLREGRNRQVRRLGEATGFPVMRLARQSQAGISIEGLRPGEWRWLSADELTDLKRAFGVPRRVRNNTPDPKRKPAFSARPRRPETKRSPNTSPARSAPNKAARARPVTDKRRTRPATNRTREPR